MPDHAFEVRKLMAPTDTELLNAFEKLLRSDDAMVEFWYDRDAKILFAGGDMGDNIRAALTALLCKSQ